MGPKNDHCLRYNVVHLATVHVQWETYSGLVWHDQVSNSPDPNLMRHAGPSSIHGSSTSEPTRVKGSTDISGVLQFHEGSACSARGFGHMEGRIQGLPVECCTVAMLSVFLDKKVESEQTSSSLVCKHWHGFLRTFWHTFIVIFQLFVTRGLQQK